MNSRKPVATSNILREIFVIRKIIHVDSFIQRACPLGIGLILDTASCEPLPSNTFFTEKASTIVIPNDINPMSPPRQFNRQAINEYSVAAKVKSRVDRHAEFKRLFHFQPDVLTELHRIWL